MMDAAENCNMPDGTKAYCSPLNLNAQHFQESLAIA